MKNKHAYLISCSAVCLLAMGNVYAQYPKTEHSIEQCLHAALAEKNGGVVKVELKIENNIPVYEFDIETADSKAWDIECNTQTGKITEIEQEVGSADDALFKAKLKVTEQDAKKNCIS
ncbi:PepSY domain-containing protein [Methylocucumis oryzae]|uniref:PepSY domain-containing protein n=1 Tax=Methylocucumis oryzae TaxID=1632867 RepID=UPI0019552B0C|nr:PepSY domain-containing protein [Methylocucumis oryzae]